MTSHTYYKRNHKVQRASSETMFSPKNHHHVRTLVLSSIVLSLMLFISIWSPPLSPSLCSSPYNNMAPPPPQPRDELETALSGASMANKTLIIAILNKAYVEGEKPTMLDLFLESFWVGEKTRFLVDHLLLVAMDQTAFDRCRFLRLHCYRVVTDGVDFGGEKLYMSHDFINMMWRRTVFLAEVLHRGYSFVFTDIDIMWLRNPFSRLSRNETYDMQISCDVFSRTQQCKFNLINTGFYFVRSNNNTIALFNRWYAARNDTNYTGMKEQDVLKQMIQDGGLSDLDLRIRYLNTRYFSGFCQDSKRFGAVTTVHANCCRTINAKVDDLTAVLRDWKKLKELRVGRKSLKASSNVTRTVKWSEHSSCWNSWKNFNKTAN